jgi:hypothetical protein
VEATHFPGPTSHKDDATKKGKESILSTEVGSDSSDDEEEDQGKPKSPPALMSFPTRSSGLAFRPVGQPEGSVDPNIQLKGETLSKGPTDPFDSNTAGPIQDKEKDTSN